MPKSSESINNSLFDLLRSKGYNPTMLDTAGKEIPVPDEAEVFQFDFIKDEVNYGTVTISIDGLKKLTIYYNDSVANSKKHDNDESTGSSWYSLLKQLKKFAKNRQLGFELKNSNHLKHDMAKRDFMKQQNKISEGYYPMGKKASYSDNVPNVKIVIEHTRQIEEGEQRYRNINRIFLENQLGERFLLDTKKPGIARVYARHVAEGGKVNDERWGHINNLCEEYQKMAGFVRATRNGQFNESAQKLVNEGINHYQSLRETLSRMTGHRGYNMYFESWTPPLMEDEADTNAINELFVQETLDPRIESVMPILSKLHKQVAEMKEVSELSEWADSLLEGGDGGEASEEPIFTEPVDELPAGGNDAPEDNLDEGTEPTLDDVLARHSDAVEAFRQGGDMDYDLESDLWDYYFNNGDIKNYDADASEFLSQKLADHLGIDESLDESGLQAYLGNKKYGKAGREHAGKEKMAKIRAKYDKLDEVDMEEGLGNVVKKVGGALKSAGKKALDVVAPGDEELLRRLQKSAGVPQHAQHGKSSMAKPNNEGVAEGVARSFDPQLIEILKQRGFKGPMAVGRAKKWIPAVKEVATNGNFSIGADDIIMVSGSDPDYDPWVLYVPKVGKYIYNEGMAYNLLTAKQVVKFTVPKDDDDFFEGVAEGAASKFSTDMHDRIKNASKEELSSIATNLAGDGFGSSERWNDEYRLLVAAQQELLGSVQAQRQLWASQRSQDIQNRLDKTLKSKYPNINVAEDLDANQKRVGQLGPTEKVKNNNIGKLVGANENFINMSPQAVAEGQEDLDAILRIIRK